MRLRLSLTTRLTLLFACLSAVLLLGFASLIGTTIESHFADLDGHELEGKLLLIRHEIERVDSPVALSGLPGQLRDALVGHPHLALTVIGPDGELLFSTGDIRIPATYVNQTKDVFEWHSDNHLFRGLTRTIASAIPNTKPFTVAVAIDTMHHAEFLTRFKKMLTLFVIGATFISGLLGWVAARSGLAPLRIMKARAETVTAQKLDLRLPADSVPVEMADLATTFNAMLERLEQAFNRLSDFSSDLAHELRTPISNLMIQTQVALSRSRSADTYHDILASNAEEFERLSRMIADMLFLAKADHGLMLPSPESIDLCTETRELFDFYDALAEEKKITLRCDGHGELVGDRLMMRRALSNLIANALRHTPAEGSVSVALKTSPQATTIKIENSGDIIEPNQIPRLFERFYRADAARERDGESGTGLGLAIVKAIVIAHGGEISVTSSQGITCFVIRFESPRL